MAAIDDWIIVGHRHFFWLVGKKCWRTIARTYVVRIGSRSTYDEEDDRRNDSSTYVCSLYGTLYQSSRSFRLKDFNSTHSIECHSDYSWWLPWSHVQPDSTSKIHPQLFPTRIRTCGPREETFLPCVTIAPYILLLVTITTMKLAILAVLVS